MNWKNAEGTSIADNPCWGGPEPHHHDLEYLLRVLGSADQIIESSQKSNSNDNITHDEAVPSPISPSSIATLIDRVIKRLVIHHDENYIAIHKPADLRMDGPHRATVHKLLLYLFPPPSLLQSLQRDTTNNNNNEETIRAQNRHEHLLNSIAPLTNTSNLNDDPFRTVHQLDYATSGVLLMGKHRKAAGAACISFQERRAKKRYVAVVTNNSNNSVGECNGGVPFDQEFFDSISILPEESLKPWAAGSLEKQYRKKRRRDTDGKDTFNGYMPEHSVFAKWRGCMIKERKKKDGVDGNNKKDGGGNAKKKKSKYYGKQQSNHQQDEVIASLIQSSAQHLMMEEVDELLSIGASWKKVKAYCESSTKENICNWPATVSKMTKEYNEKTSAAAASTGEEQSINSSDKAKSATTNNDDEAKTDTATLPPLFRIKDDKDSDSFYICASIGEVADGRFDVIVDPSAAKPLSQPNTPSILPEMKPSLTKCTVLWRGHVDDATTNNKVPMAKILLSPWTGRRHQLRVHLSRVAGYPILGDVAYTKGTEGRGAIGSRMCLHAKELVIPLLGGQAHTFTAMDPFVVEGDSIQIDNFC